MSTEYACPKHTPWGVADSIHKIADGIFSVGTPSHGGIKLSPALNKKVPEYLRAEGGWYEEDCDWCIPFVVFEKYLLEHGDNHSARVIVGGNHLKTFKSWHPDGYERFTGKELLPGESTVRDEKLFLAAHADDLIAISACGSWHAAVPKGFVGVLATVGASRVPGASKSGLRFLVPEDEYDARSHFGFIVDPAKHAAWDPNAAVAV